MAGDINVYEGAANSGTEWDSLAGGLAAASSGDVIEISGAWTASDSSSGNAVSLANLTIRAVGDAKYVPGSTGHYVLDLDSGTQHGFNFTGATSLTLEGFEIKLDTTTSSREVVRMASDGTLNVTDMHIWATGANSDQDGIYSYHAYAPTINITNSIIHGFARGAINYQIYSGGQNPGAVAINILSSTIYNANSGNDAQGGGIVADGGEINFDMDITIKVQDTLVHVSNGFAIGAGLNGTRHDGSAGNGTLTIDVDNCIVSDDMTPTPTGIDSFTNSLDNASFVETSTGTGTEVVFVDLTAAPYDFSLVDDADNDAQDYHSDAGLLITIPSADIVGTSRPQNTDYDLGAFEIVSGGGAGDLSADFLSSGSVVYEPTLFGVADLSADFLASGSTVHEPALQAADADISADFLPSGSQLFEPTLDPGQADIDAGFLSSASVVYEPELQAAGATIDADFIASGSQVFEPTLEPGTATLFADLLASGSIIYEPALTGAAADLSADFLPSGSTIHEPELTGAGTISADFLASGSQLFEPTLEPGAAALAVDFLPSGAALYEPALVGGTGELEADFLASASALYQPTLIDSTTALPSGITSLTAHRVGGFYAIKQ